MANAGVDECFQVLRARLRLSVEDGVSAPHVCEDKMVGTAVVSQVQVLALAWMATIFVRVSVGHESTEHAVFGMEDWQMLMDDDFELGRARGTEGDCERALLLGVQVMRWRQALES